MALAKADVQCTSAMLALLAAVLLLSPGAAARPLLSGWDVSLSTVSSDSTLWRKFTTAAQAAGYHRLLLDLGTSRKAQETVEEGDLTAKNEIPAYNFDTMDYAEPRSNKPGSSDQMSPPAP